MKVIFSGDLFLGGDLIDQNLRDNILIKSFHEADMRIVNLEHPISNNSFFQEKCVLYTEEDSVKQLVNSNINAVNIAHNHIHDKGDSGITDTINILKKNGIGYFGAGENIEEARKPFKINEDLYVLGYCQFNSPTLNNIQIAEKNKPGINPLIKENIIEDIEKLPENVKVVLFFHWGREHVWFTQYKNIELSRYLLKNNKVAHIIGSHPHRIQGVLSYGNKKACYSLGNFLFPNFYMSSPSVYIPKPEKDLNFDVTKQYHSVQKLTYKKWRLVNRISNLVELDTNNSSLNHIFSLQDFNSPIVTQIVGVKRLIVIAFIKFISLFYLLPKRIYILIEYTTSTLKFFIWYFQILLFKIRKYGLKWFVFKLKNYVKK